MLTQDNITFKTANKSTSKFKVIDENDEKKNRILVPEFIFDGTLNKILIFIHEHRIHSSTKNRA